MRAERLNHVRAPQRADNTENQSPVPALRPGFSFWLCRRGFSPGLINPCQVVVRLWWWFPCHHRLLIPLKSGRSPGTSGVSKPNGTKPNAYDTVTDDELAAIASRATLHVPIARSNFRVDCALSFGGSRREA